MRSSSVSAGQSGLASQYNDLRDDAYGGSELLAHEQGTPNMTLYVEPGVYYIGTTRVIFGGGNTPTFTAPTTNPRIDIVTADSSGTIAITQGTEASSPVAPSYPTNKVVICEVYNVVGETVIHDNDAQVSGQGYIANDVRPLNSLPYISDASQVASGLFIPWISSPAQGDIIYYDGSAWARLPAGTSGQVLETQGSGANPQWATPFGTKLAQVFSGLGGTLTQNVDTNVGAVSSIPAVAATGSIRIRGQLTPNNGNTTFKFNAGGSSTQTMGAVGSSSSLFEINIVNINSQTTNDFYGFIINGGTVKTFSGSLSGDFSAAWTFNLLGNDTASGGSCTVDFIDVYIIG